MKKYLVDANLPSKINIWQTDEFEFVSKINDEWTDSEIWDYAKQNNLTIISKDSDFSHRIIVSVPPPKIIHIKIGNLKLKDFSSAIEKVWATAEKPRKIISWSMVSSIESKPSNNYPIGSRSIISAV